MKILITGGAGFIGSNLAEQSIQAGHTVVVFDDFSTGRRENLEGIIDHPDFTLIEGSILDRSHLTDVMQTFSIEAVSHQAARPSVARSVEDPLATNEINVTGTLNMLKAALDSGVKKVVTAISSSVYGDTPELPKRETMPYNPQSPYAVSKVTKELYLKVFHDIYGLDTVGLRYFNVYGRKQDPKSDYAAVIPKFVTAALKGEPITIEGDGGQTRDFTYIDDVVAANLAGFVQDQAAGRSFNIAYGERISILELAEKIIEITGSRSEISYREKRQGDIRHSLADISYAEKYLAYHPQFDLEKGLTETIRWYQSVLVEP
ncbi:MAG: SDR family oxidoreductase [Deltaproteobacteria bacterium]|nr:SDR family oxidoreductase [Deltaproteobacteria bacterium]